MNERVARCHLIASVLAADGRIDPSERELLRQTMTRFQLTSEEQDRVMHFENSGEALATARLLPQSERQALVDELVQAALVDGQLSPLESKLVAKLSAALELHSVDS